MKWKFQPRYPGAGKNRNPLGDEFFTDPDLLTDASSLVREAIQNSLDAQEDPESVLRVRFKIGVREFESVDSSPFSGLEVHAQATLGPVAGKIDSICRYLVYEDFNTTGLIGDSNADAANPALPKRDQSYTFFVHYEGEGSKDEGSRGKWGVGKVVFPKISKIKAHLNYSVRSLDNAPCGKSNVFIGQAVLKYHELNDINFQPDGWLAENMDPVPIPFSGEVAHAEAEAWGVTRGEDERGLSIVVPYISDDLEIAQFRDAVIRQYFLAIVGGEIECSFEDEFGYQLILDSSNILSVIEGLRVLSEGSSRDLSAYQVKTAMAAFVTAVNKCKAIDLQVPDNSLAPSGLAVSELAIQAGLKSLEEHGVAWFTVGVEVPRRNTSHTEHDVFEVLITKADGDNPIIFSREQILVPGTRAINVAGHIAIVLTDKGPLADLLGSAEGPAHEDWRDDTKRFKLSFDQPKEAKARASRLLKVVRQFPKKIVQELTKSEDAEKDTTFFADWFAPPKPEGKKPDPDDGGGLPDPKLPGRTASKGPPTFSVAGGVLKVKSGTTTYKVGSTLSLELAYSVSRGNAFKKWNEADFSLGVNSSLTFAATGLEIVSREKRTISLSVIDPNDWTLEIAGFLAYRDLEVRSTVFDKEGK
jgi:hypothetical protein